LGSAFMVIDLAQGWPVLGGLGHVLDWSAGLLAPAAYDVAFTGLVLAEPPVAVPSMLRPVVRAVGRFLARRFRSAYVRLSRVDVEADSLQWYEGVVCLRALVEVAGWVAAGTADGRTGHPWIVCGIRRPPVSSDRSNGEVSMSALDAVGEC